MKQTSITENSTFSGSKIVFGLFFLVLTFLPFKQLLAQTKWYYNGTGALNSTSSWGTNTNGTGGTLSDFTSGNRQFIIQNTTAVSLTGVWNIGNTSFGNAGGDSLIIGNPTTPAAPITFTLLSGSALTVNKSRTISVSVPSSGNHKIIYQNSTVISFGAINDPNLELVFDGATITSSSTNSFGDLSLINNAVVDMGGANAKFRNITVDNGSTLSGPIGASSNFLGIRAGGLVTINGTFRAGKPGGLATTSSVSVFPVTTSTSGSNSFANNATAVTSASTTGLTRTVTCSSTTQLQVGDIITVASGTGAFPAGTFVRSITNSTTFVASAAATTQLSAATISRARYTLPLSSSAGITVGGALTKNSGTGTFATNSVVTGIINGTSIAISAAPTSNFASGASIIVSFAAATTWSTLVFEDFIPNLVLGSNSTIDFNRGTSGQTASQSIDTLSYANLILSNSGAVSNKLFIAGTMNVSGSFTVSNLLGTITQPSTTTINFTGTSAQTIPSQLTTFSVLGISGGTKTMSGNVSVTSSLNLTSGVLTTGSNTLTVTSAGTVARTSGWVNGNLNRNIGTGAVTRVFHIGDSTNYTPITLTFANVTTAGNLTASTGTPISSVANYGSSPLSSNAYVNRFWNITNASALAFTTYDASMTYVAGDLVGGATASSVLAARYNGAWTTSTTTAGTLSNTVTSLSSLATSFILGNCANPVTPSVSLSSTATTLCTATNATFTATASNGGSSPSYQWKRNSTNIGTNSNTIDLNNTNVSNGDTIRCVLTANNTCQTSATATSNALVLTVGSIVTPSVSISTASDTVCSSSSVTFTALGTNAGSSPVYTWNKNGSSVGTGSSITFPAGTLSTSDLINCVLTANNPCQTSATANSNTRTMFVKASPAIGTTKGFTACTLGSTIFIYNSNTQGGGIWSSSNTGVATVTTGVNGGTGLVVPTGNGFAILTFTKTGSNGCVSTASDTVKVAVATAPDAITGTNSICRGNTTQLSTTTTGGVWSISPSGYASINSTGLVTSTNTGVATAKYTVSNANGCSASASYTVTVNAFPLIPTIGYQIGAINPQIGAGGSNFCTNRSFTVVGSPSGGVWSKTGVISVTSPAGLVTTGNSAGVGTLTYTFTNVNGCSSSRTITGNVVNCASRGVNGGVAIIDKLANSEDFTMFPNPAKSFISLNVKSVIGTGSIVVTDLFGKQIKAQSLSIGNNTIDIATLTKGIYFVSMITSEGKTTKKLVVE